MAERLIERVGPAVACALAAVGIWGCSSGARETRAAPPPSAVAPTTTERPTEAEVGGAVRVVDRGLTNGVVVGCNTAGGQATGWYPSGCAPEDREPIQDSVLYGSVSYGFVLENTTDQVILGLPVTYRFLDREGAVIREHATAFSDGDPTGDTTTVPLLRPGERVGVGGMRYPGRPDAAEIQVEVGRPADWMPEASWTATHAAASGGAGELTVTEVAVRPGESAEPVTSFTVESTYGQPVDPTAAYVVFYDAGGRIIGGADGAFAVDRIPAGGAIEGEIALDDPIEVPGIDPARTEVYFPGWEVRQR